MKSVKIVIKGEIEKRMEELYVRNRDHVKKFIVWRLSLQDKEIEEPEEEETYISNEVVEFLAEKFDV